MNTLNEVNDLIDSLSDKELQERLDMGNDHPMVLTYNRPDKATELIVSRGIILAQLESVNAGASYMAEQDVPFDVAQRVLLQPHLRRPTDWR